MARIRKDGREDRVGASSLGARIREVWKASGLSQEEFAERLGIVPQTLINYIKDRRSPNVGFIKGVCDEFNVCIEWLFHGRGPMRIDSGPTLTPPHFPEQSTSLIVYRPARRGEELVPFGSRIVDTAWLRSFGDPDAFILMGVSGDAMAPTLQDGDLALINRDVSFVESGRIYALSCGETIVFRRLDRTVGDRRVFKPENPDHDPIEMEPGNVSLVGMVVAITRSLVRM